MLKHLWRSTYKLFPAVFVTAGYGLAFGMTSHKMVQSFSLVAFLQIYWLFNHNFYYVGDV